MIEKHVSTFWVRLYLSGPIDVAKQIIRRECMGEGLCVTVDPTTFIYTGGEEIGYVVGLINYPRFPSTEEQLLERATRLLHVLRAETYQSSGLLMTPNESHWYSVRSE